MDLTNVVNELGKINDTLKAILEELKRPNTCDTNKSKNEYLALRAKLLGRSDGDYKSIYNSIVTKIAKLIELEIITYDEAIIIYKQIHTYDTMNELKYHNNLVSHTDLSNYIGRKIKSPIWEEVGVYEND